MINQLSGLLDLIISIMNYQILFNKYLDQLCRGSYPNKIYREPAEKNKAELVAEKLSLTPSEIDLIEEQVRTYTSQLIAFTTLKSDSIEQAAKDFRQGYFQFIAINQGQQAAVLKQQCQ